MIQKLTSEILQAAYEGFKATSEEVSRDKFATQNVQKLNTAIEQMFKLLNIKVDLDKLKSIMYLSNLG
jgi:hypothetical protein